MVFGIFMDRNITLLESATSAVQVYNHFEVIFFIYQFIYSIFMDCNITLPDSATSAVQVYYHFEVIFLYIQYIQYSIFVDRNITATLLLLESATNIF